MHPDVSMDQSGNCPKCGMLLKPIEKALPTYSCPNHPNIISTDPGNCSICSTTMRLNLSPKEKMKYDVMKLYTCPMHPEVKSDKSGKCPKCGMTLAEKKQ